MAETENVQKKNYPIYIMTACVGVIIILVGMAYRGDTFNVWADTAIDVGKALIIGPTISLILDLPAMINYFKKITIESLVSEEYLGTLTRDRLLDLRKKCTARIHLKDAKSVEQGLIDIDESICELLTKTYHERYRQTVSCKVEGDYVIKTHRIEEYIINPLGTTGNSIKMPENMKFFVYKNDHENINALFKVTKFVVSADDKEEVDYCSKGLKIKEENSDPSDTPYDSQISVVDNDNNPIIFEFIRGLKIEKVYEMRVLKSDKTFLKRVKIPVKSFRLDYHFPDADVKLKASCFGTLAFSSEGNIKIIHGDDYVSIESYSWLLPGNGVFVVAV